jgi:2,3-dihydroxyethylbenzene 1,2-dioxygenase
MTQTTELGYLGLGVSDLQAWKTFAADTVGLEWVEGEDASCAYLKMDFWHHRIALRQSDSDDMQYLGLRVAGIEEFNAMYEKLQKAGIEVSMGSKALAAERHVLAVMQLQDPSGVPVEIFHGPHVETEKPFYPSRPMYGKFRTGSGGLGHILLHRTASVEETYRFYQTLGMRGGVEYKVPVPYQEDPLEFLFMHCVGGSRQHTLSFGTGEDKMLNHLMLELTEFNDLGQSHQLIAKSKYPIPIDLGKHANDDMYSFYMATPSGWLLELGWGGGDPAPQSEYYQCDTFGHDTMDGIIDFGED